jgi:hypothetical protein
MLIGEVGTFLRYFHEVYTLATVLYADLLYRISLKLRNNKRGNVRTSNIKARSRQQCRRGKAIIITYYECVSVALVIQHGKCMRRVIYGFPGSARCFHVVSKTTRFP